MASLQQETNLKLTTWSVHKRHNHEEETLRTPFSCVNLQVTWLTGRIKELELTEHLHQDKKKDMAKFGDTLTSISKDAEEYLEDLEIYATTHLAGLLEKNKEKA